MSLATITITRQLPIINSFVQLPNNNPGNKTSVPVAGFVAATGGVVKRLSQGSRMGRNGGRFGPQEWVELTEVLGTYNYEEEYGKTLYHTNVRTDQVMPWV